MSDQSDYREQADDDSKSGLREESEEAATGRPGVDDQFEEAAAEAVRIEEGRDDRSDDTAGSSPVSSSGAGEPATSSSEELPSGS